MSLIDSKYINLCFLLSVKALQMEVGVVWERAGLSCHSSVVTWPAYLPSLYFGLFVLGCTSRNCWWASERTWICEKYLISLRLLLQIINACFIFTSEYVKPVTDKQHIIYHHGGRWCVFCVHTGNPFLSNHWLGCTFGQDYNFRHCLWPR